MSTTESIPTLFTDAADKAKTAAMTAFLAVVATEHHLPDLACDGRCETGSGQPCLNLEVRARSLLPALGLFMLEIDSTVGILELAVEHSEVSPVHGELATMSAVGSLIRMCDRVFHIRSTMLDMVGELPPGHTDTAEACRQAASVTLPVLNAVPAVVRNRP